MEKIISKKLRGGYYTPKRITDFISDWAINDKQDSVLEPSCGDGAFIESMIDRFSILGTNKTDIPKNIHGIEFLKEEADKAASKYKKFDIDLKVNSILTGDFFEYCINNLMGKIYFNSVIGNPPFIRYQDFPEKQRNLAFDLMNRAGLKPTKLTNTWIPFLVASTLLLKEKGKLGMVIPAELFQVNYAAETRLFLSKSFSSINIITFRKLVFDGIQQEIVLLLAEKNGKKMHGINVIELNDIDELLNFNLSTHKVNPIQLNHSTEKWTQYYLNNEELNLLRRLKDDQTIPVTGDYMNVDVGVVTGQNKFFVVSKNDVDKYKINSYVKKIVGRSNHLKGIMISNDEMDDLAQMQNPMFLLDAPNVDYEKLPINVKNYVNYGEQSGYNLGYKCRIRKRWWLVPKPWQPDAFMLRQVNGYPKLILNKCNATATDTLHRVKFTNGIKGEILTTAFLNSLTFAVAEVTGRSYGGGVLTFEPSEAERLPLPLKFADEIDHTEIDRLIRSGQIERILDMNDNILLKKGLNLTDNELRMLRNIWIKLRDRRINRKHGIIKFESLSIKSIKKNSVRTKKYLLPNFLPEGLVTMT